MSLHASLWRLVKVSLGIALFGFLAPSAVFAGQCQCPCFDGAAVQATSGGSCTQNSQCTRDLCLIVCTDHSLSMRGTAQDPEPFTCNTAAPAPAPATPPAATAGNCSFQCAPTGSPASGRVTPPIVVSCTQNVDCISACRMRCPVPGNPTTDGNGLSVAEGTGLGCVFRDPSPRCVVNGQPLTGTGTPTGESTPSTAAANRQTANTAAELPNPVGTTDMVALLGRVVKALFGIMGALALMWFIWGGMLWMTAEESKRTEDAKVIMKNAALGIVLLFFSYGLASSFLGIFQAAAGGATATRSSSSNTTNTTAP